MTINEMYEQAPWKSDYYDDIEYCFGRSDWIDDVIMEIASDKVNNAADCDIDEVLSDHSREVDDIISEFGWDGVGKSIRIAAAYVLENMIRDEIYENLVDDLINCAVNYLWEKYEYEDYPEELYALIVEWCNESLEHMDDVSDQIDDWVEENMRGGEFDDDVELNDILEVE